MFAGTYPLADLLLTMLEIFLFVIFIWLLIAIFADILRSHDMGGLAKALWVIFIIVFPFIGILVYLIARGGTMHERAYESARHSQQAMDQYIRQTAGAPDPADQLAKLADLKDRGVITQEEFDRQKAKLLA